MNMITDRLEKIKFIADEMQIAFHLTTALEDPFLARMIARHVLIRAKDFIAHVRVLRKPLNDAGYDTREFHKKKEIYARTFEEYFAIARDRLGAHVQDLDFGKRIELWKDIEFSKIEYLCEGALEVYGSLATLNIPGYQVYIEPTVISDRAVSEHFENFRRSNAQTQGIEIASDPLALTRQNTSAGINNTPVHARAGQLSLIRRWIKTQTELLNLLEAHLSVYRILKMRVLTDIVSYCDCLVTRNVAAGAPQQMDGLNTLLVAAGQSSIPIDTFVSTTNFDIELGKIRDLRNQICAHLETEPATTLTSLLGALDNFDMQEAIKFYQDVNSVFTKICRNVLFLTMYALDGQKIHGVLASANQGVPFTENGLSKQPNAVLKPPVYNCEKVYHENLQRWLHGDESQKEEARHYFWNAFESSTTVEQLTEVEEWDTSKHFKRYEFRTAHEFIHSVLSDNPSNFDFRGTLELLTSCASGSPYPLCQILINIAPNTNEDQNLLLCIAFGEIGGRQHTAVNSFLKNCMSAKHHQIRLQARLGLFKRFVRSEGIYRANHKGQIKEDFDDVVKPMLDSLSGMEKFACLLVLASALCVPPANSFFKAFKDNYSELQLKIKDTIQFLFEADRNSNETIDGLFNNHDYIGLCLYIVLEIVKEKDNPNSTMLLDLCCDGTVRSLWHDQSLRHLAICYHLREQHNNAYALAEKIALKNPEKAMPQIFAIEMMMGGIENRNEITQQIQDIRRRYTLDPDEEGRLVAIETQFDDV